MLRNYLPGERIDAVDGGILIDLGELNESVWVDAPAVTGDFGPVPIENITYVVRR